VRIIAGELRGRKIIAPPGLATRPMLDRVREAMFSTLQRRMPGAAVLDLFAGSGSLGLEALSRGARRVRFVERSAPALDALRKNVATLGVAARCEIVVADAQKAASWGPAADVIFCDPPYALLEEDRDRVLRMVAALVGGQLADAGVVVLHAPRGGLAESDFSDVAARVRRYGTNDLWYLRQTGA
jgi:16S rRNA (guanine966-N2)-methyltransferase